MSGGGYGPSGACVISGRPLGFRWRRSESSIRGPAWGPLLANFPVQLPRIWFLLGRRMVGSCDVGAACVFFFFFLREKVTGARNSVLGKHLWADMNAPLTTTTTVDAS